MACTKKPNLQTQRRSQYLFNLHWIHVDWNTPMTSSCCPHNPYSKRTIRQEWQHDSSCEYPFTTSLHYSWSKFLTTIWERLTAWMVNVHCKHCKASILELLDLELSQSVWVAGQLEGIKSTTRVKGVQALAERPTADPVALDETHENNLNQQAVYITCPSNGTARSCTALIPGTGSVLVLWYTILKCQCEVPTSLWTTFRWV